MHRKAVMVLGLALFAGVTMGQQSRSTETTDKPDAPGGDSGGKRPRARLGDAITLKGTDAKLKVKVLRVSRNLQVGEFDKPQSPRNRFVGVFVRLTNVGRKTYKDSPSNGAKLITSHDEQADPAIITTGSCSSTFASDVTLSSGSSQQGCIPFEIKRSAKPKTFQFGLDSGFGPQTGEWSLRR